MANGFFRKVLPEEHSLVWANEKRLTKFEFLILFFAVLSLLTDLAVIIDALFLGNTFWPSLAESARGRRARVSIIMSLVVIEPLMIVFVTAKIRQLIKVKNGDYVVQRAMPISIVPGSKSIWKRTVKVTFLSDNGMLYVTDIYMIAAKEMQLNKPGLLVRVNRNRPPIVYDECRFIRV